MKTLSLAALCMLQDPLPYERSQSVPTLIPKLDAGCTVSARYACTTPEPQPQAGATSRCR
jgi:hypothetical protein